MKQLTFLMTDKQHETLTRRAKELEVSISEQIRRAIELYLKEEDFRDEHRN